MIFGLCNWVRKYESLPKQNLHCAVPFLFIFFCSEGRQTVSFEYEKKNLQHAAPPTIIAGGVKAFCLHLRILNLIIRSSPAQPWRRERRRVEKRKCIEERKKEKKTREWLTSHFVHSPDARSFSVKLTRRGIKKKKGKNKRSKEFSEKTFFLFLAVVALIKGKKRLKKVSFVAFRGFLATLIDFLKTLPSGNSFFCLCLDHKFLLTNHITSRRSLPQLPRPSQRRILRVQTMSY